MPVSSEPLTSARVGSCTARTEGRERADVCCPSVAVAMMTRGVCRLSWRSPSLFSRGHATLTCLVPPTRSTAASSDSTYIQPGKPDQNASSSGSITAFGKRSSTQISSTFDHVRELTGAWLETYNTERPHDSLGQVPPLTSLPRPDAPAKSIFRVSTRTGNLARSDGVGLDATSRFAEASSRRRGILATRWCTQPGPSPGTRVSPSRVSRGALSGPDGRDDPPTPVAPGKS